MYHINESRNLFFLAENFQFLAKKIGLIKLIPSN